MAVAAERTLGAVLAGGLGRRVGGAKASLQLDGRPLISYPLAALEEAGLPAVVVAKADSGAPPLSVPVITEPGEPRHPLCGIVAALEYASRQGYGAVVVVACDMPRLPPALLGWLARLDDPLAVPVVDGHPQPLVARYSTALLTTLRTHLLAEPGSLRNIVAALEPRLISEDELARFGDPRQAFLNVNTTADLDRAATL